MGDKLALFREEQIKNRDAVCRAAVDALVREGALAVHQFGSLAHGRGDELSDLDLWTTFRDQDIASVVARRDDCYGRVAPVAIKHENPRNRPVGGAYSLVIYETPAGLFQVDYYLSARSMSPVPAGAVLLHGAEMPRGEWVLDHGCADQDTKTEHIAFLACMSFILAKGLMRGWDRGFFERTRESVAELTGASDLPTKYDYDTLVQMASRLSEVAEPAQRGSLAKIGAHLSKLASVCGQRQGEPRPS